MRNHACVRVFVLVAMCLGAVSAGIAGAQEKPTFNLTLEELLKVRVVAAAAREQRPFDSPRSISVLTAEDLKRRNYRSTPEALEELVGVMVQQTNDGGGSPILRGLIGNQVLLMVDGIRMNNAVYRLGPNQYLNTVDINQIERIEIVRGPGSVLYGSDALGGIVNIVTKSRVIGDANPAAFEVSARSATANGTITGRVAYAGGTDRFSLVGGVSLKSFGSLRKGGGRVEPFTGYDEWDADLKVAVKPRDGQTVTAILQHVTQFDVPRTDVLQAGTDLEYRWDPQRRTLAAGQWSAKRGSGLLREVFASGSYQEQSEHVFRVTAASPSRQSEYEDRDRTLAGRVQLFSVLGRNSVTYGLELSRDWVRSTRVDRVLTTGEQIPRRGTYADGARASAAAVYAQDQVDVTDRLALELGTRFSWSRLLASLTDQLTGAVPVDARNHGLVGSAYGSYRIHDSLKLVAGVSQGFRAPNVDDVSILGSFAGGFEVPNQLLKPERSVNVVGGLKFAGSRMIANASVFDARYRELIARAPATYNGQAFLDVNANGTRESNEPLVFRRQNIGRARVRGVEIDSQLRVTGRWTVGGNLSWISGDDLSAGEPLRRTPPLHGMLRVLFESGSRWWIESYGLLAGDQRRLNPGDITDIRIGPGGTPGFATVNLRGGVVMPVLGTLTLGVENIGDRAYKWHGSGVARPGRNVVLGLRRTF